MYKTIDGISYLVCFTCSKQVSSGFVPIITDFMRFGTDRQDGIVIRACIFCPECIEKEVKENDPS